VKYRYGGHEIRESDSTLMKEWGQLETGQRGGDLREHLRGGSARTKEWGEERGVGLERQEKDVGAKKKKNGDDSQEGETT